METWRNGLRVPVVMLVIVAMFIAAALGVYVTQMQDSSREAPFYELIDHSGNKNDGKDNCPHDGNAGKGNDNKGPNGGCRPPKGEYKKIK